MAGGGLPPKRLPSLFLASSPSFLGGGRAADDFEAGGAAVLGPPKMAPNLFLKLSSEDAWLTMVFPDPVLDTSVFWHAAKVGCAFTIAPAATASSIEALQAFMATFMARSSSPTAADTKSAINGCALATHQSTIRFFSTFPSPLGSSAEASFATSCAPTLASRAAASAKAAEVADLALPADTPVALPEGLQPRSSNSKLTFLASMAPLFFTLKSMWLSKISASPLTRSFFALVAAPTTPEAAAAAPPPTTAASPDTPLSRSAFA
mmetsp:Transcript_67221/g.115428  ORF Transcript_67221/g.115428 Transcript_67221/m.115428 type:complete len:264 (-) Transcript_67221:950-1741(-)